MRRGPILIFIVILILAIGFGVLYFLYTQFVGGGGFTTTVPTPTALTEVYFAAQNIPQGTEITAEMLDTFSIPPENVAEVMFTAGEEGSLIGQTARLTLDQGVVITSSMVGTGPLEIAGPQWAVKIPSGMVAAAIPTNRYLLAGYGVADGAHVNVNACIHFVDVDPAFQTILPNFASTMQDVYFPTEGGRPSLSLEPLTSEWAARQGRTEIEPTFQKPLYVVPSEQQRPRLVCQMILQDVVVLKVGNFGVQAPPTDPNATPSPAQAAQTEQQATPDIVTLMVSPQDSIALNYFVYSGAMLNLSLRNPNDTSRFSAESATLTSMLTQYNISLPSKLPYATHPQYQLIPPAVETAAPAQ
jgi:Flp pilus assembly protein CpaB